MAKSPKKENKKVAVEDLPEKFLYVKKLNLSLYQLIEAVKEGNTITSQRVIREDVPVVVLQAFHVHLRRQEFENERGN
jgi:hypothetical protein